MTDTEPEPLRVGVVGVGAHATSAGCSAAGEVASLELTSRIARLVV